MIFNRNDLRERIGKRAEAKINTLNRYNLGEPKTVRLKRPNHPAVNHRDVIKSVRHYDTKECIKFFKRRVREEQDDPSARYKMQHIKQWTEIIELMEEMEIKQ